MASQLEKSILATVAYFDVFDYPLTLLELRRMLLGRHDVQHTLEDIQDVLAQSPLLSKAVREKNGFLYARGREENVRERRTRFLVSREKFERSRFALRLLSRMPFVRGLFVCNSLALENATPKSDVDVAVVAKTGGAWWARLFCLLLLSALRRRPGQPGNKPKICLSFFVDEAHLDAAALRMSENDIDFAYWVANFYPVYDAGNCYERFWAANQPWLLNVLPNARPIIPHPSRVMRHKPFFRMAGELLLAPLGACARAIQEKKFPAAIRELANRDTRVRVEEGVLKFHVNDRRIAHMELFVTRYESLLSLRGSEATEAIS